MLGLHPIAIRLLALAALAAAAGAAATRYSTPGRQAGSTAALAAVGGAAAAAGAWFQDPWGGDGSYRGMDAAALAHEAPAVPANVHVTVLAGGSGVCLDAEQRTGEAAYYVGGDIRAARGIAVGTAVAAPDAAAVCSSLGRGLHAAG